MWYWLKTAKEGLKLQQYHISLIMWYCLLQFQALLCCLQSIPHDSDMFIVCCSFRPSFAVLLIPHDSDMFIVCCSFRPSFAVLNTTSQWYVYCLLQFQALLCCLQQYHINMIMSCGIDWGQFQEGLWNCLSVSIPHDSDMQTIIVIGIAAVSGPPLLSSVNTTWQWYVYCLLQFQALLCCPQSIPHDSDMFIVCCSFRPSFAVLSQYHMTVICLLFAAVSGPPLLSSVNTTCSSDMFIVCCSFRPSFAAVNISLNSCGIEWGQQRRAWNCSKQWYVYCLLQFQALLCCLDSQYHMTVICLLFAAVSGPPLLSSVNTTWQWYVYCLLQFQALLCCLQSIPHDSDMFIVCCSFRPSFAVLSQYHMTVICLLFAAVSGPPLLSSVNTTWQWYVYCLLQFQALLCCLQSIPHDSDMFIVCCSFRPSFAVLSQYHMTVICLLFAAVSGPPLLSSVNTTWQWYVYCLLQFQALLCCPQSIPHDSDMFIVCCSFRPSFAVLSQYHMTVICLLFAAVSGPPLLSSVNTTWQWYVYCLLQFQALLCCPQSIPHDSDMFIVCCSFRPSFAVLSQYHMTVICLLFAAVSGPPLLSSVNTTWQWYVYCLLQFQALLCCLSQYHMTVICLLFAAVSGPPLLSSVNTTWQWYVYCLLQFQALLCCLQSIPHDSDMFIVCCSFRPSFAVLSQYHMTVICLLFAAVSGPPLLSSVNTTWQWYVYCLLQFQALLCCFSQYHMTVICLLFAAVSGPPLLSSVNTTWQWYVYCLLQFQALLCCPQSIPHDSDMFIVCCSFRPSFAAQSIPHDSSDMFIVCCSFRPSFVLSSLSQYHMTVICLLFAAVSGPPLLSSVNTTWQWYVYCLLQFQALLCCLQSIPHDSDMFIVCCSFRPSFAVLSQYHMTVICLLFAAVSGPPLLSSVNTTWQWYVYCLLQFQALLCCPQSIPHDSDMFIVCCSFRPSFAVLSQYHMTVICLLFAAVSGPPLLSSVNTTWQWYVYCLLQFQALLCCLQSIPHDSDMFIVCCSFRPSFAVLSQYHMTVICLLFAAVSGPPLLSSVNTTWQWYVYCLLQFQALLCCFQSIPHDSDMFIVCCSFRPSFAVLSQYHMTVICLLFAAVSGPPLLSSVNTTWQWYVYCLLQFQALLCCLLQFQALLCCPQYHMTVICLLFAAVSGPPLLSSLDTTWQWYVYCLLQFQALLCCAVSGPPLLSSVNTTWQWYVYCLLQFQALLCCPQSIPHDSDMFIVCCSFRPSFAVLSQYHMTVICLLFAAVSGPPLLSSVNTTWQWYVYCLLQFQALLCCLQSIPHDSDMFIVCCSFRPSFAVLSQYHMTVICLLFAAVSGPPLLSSVNTTWQWYVYCLLQFQALLCCLQSIPHDSDMFIVCCSFRPSFAVFSQYHMTVICLLFAAVSGPPLLSSVNTTWQWYVYCLLQFQALLCCPQSIPHDSDMFIVCCSFRPSFAVFSQYHMTVICLLFAAVSGPPLLSSVDTTWQWYVYCLLQFQALLCCPQSIPHDSDMFIVCCSFRPSFAVLSQYHMTVICLLFAAVSGPPLLSSVNTTWQWYVYCLLQFQALLCCPQSIPHDSDMFIVCCSFRPSFAVLSQYHMTVICLLFAAVSGPPLLSSVNTTRQWYVYCLLQFQALLCCLSQYHMTVICLLFAAVSGPPLLSSVNTTWQWYVYCLLQFQALLCCPQSIPHDSDMFIVCCSFRPSFAVLSQYHMTVICLLFAAVSGPPLLSSVNTTWQWYVYCLLQFQALLCCLQSIPHDSDMFIVCCSFRPSFAVLSRYHMTVICLLFAAVSGPPLLSSVNTTWQWYVYCLLQFQALLCCPQSIPHDSDMFIVCCSFRPSFAVLSQYHMTVICLLFAAVSGPPLLSSVNTTWQWYVYAAVCCQYHMTVICVLFAAVSGPPLLSSVNTTWQWYVYCLLQFQALLCCPQSIPHDSDMFIVCCSFRPSFAVLSQYHMTVICLLFAAVSGPPLLSSVNTTWQWYVYCLLQFQALLCCLQSIPHDSDMFIVCCSFRPSFAVLSQYHMTVICLLFAAVSGPPLLSSVNTTWQWYVYCLLQFQALLCCPQSIPHDSDMFIVCCSFRPSFAVLSQYHMTVICLLFAAVSGPPLLFTQSIPHDSDMFIVCCSFRPSFAVLSQYHMTVICLLFAAVSGPPLLSSVNTTWQWYVYCLLQFQALLLSSVNTTWQWYVYCLLQFQALLCCFQSIPHDSDMFIVCCSFRPSFAVLTQYHMTVICLLFAAVSGPPLHVSSGPETAANNKHITLTAGPETANNTHVTVCGIAEDSKGGPEMQQTINMSLSCGIDWRQQRRAWNCSKQ